MNKTITVVENFFSSEFSASDCLIAGVDEVGRGALFGPVVAAAVVIPNSKLELLKEIGVKDSKKLSAKKRLQLIEPIQMLATSWQVGCASVKEIDRLNILQASLLAMKRAVVRLKLQPAICLVDGLHPIPNLAIPQQNLVRGDEISPAIAAASIIAKVWRDELIMRLAIEYCNYDLAANKGYGTKKHLSALLKYGHSNQHRRSFRIK
jgi:ribonuclease HII